VAIHIKKGKTMMTKKLLICSFLLVTNLLFGNENLALGKKVYYSIYPSNFNKDAPSRLTDGIQYSGKLNTLDSFGQMVDGSPYYVCVDLGEKKPLQLVKLFMLTNTNYHWRHTAPRQVTLLLSKDGKEFFRAGCQVKTGAYGRRLPAGTTAFDADEIGTSENVELTFQVKGAEARYIGFSILPEGFAFKLDEIQAFAPQYPHDTGAAAEMNIFGKDPEPFYIGGGLAENDQFYFGPGKDVLSVPMNVALPQVFWAVDYSGAEPAYVRYPPYAPWSGLNSFEFIIELPVGLRMLCDTPNMKAAVVTEQRDDDRIVYKIKLTAESARQGSPCRETELYARHHFGPVFIVADREFNLSEKARFGVIAKGKVLSKRVVPVETFHMPMLDKPFDADIHLSIGWMWPDFIENWPDFFTTYGKLGFNAVPIFPLSSETISPDIQKIVERAQKYGYKIISVSSPLHGIDFQKYPEAACGRAGKLCPTYTGPGYVANMERISSAAAKYPADFVFYDCEVFTSLPEYAPKCKRCMDATASSGVSLKEHFFQCGDRIVADWHKYFKKFAGDDRPFNLGLYYLAGFIGSFESVFNARNYPQYFKYTMPEFYGAGLLQQVNFMCARERAWVKEPQKTITWASAGTFGEFASFKIEPMVLEFLLHGGGITWFAAVNFDTPRDLYYSTRALKLLEPYQELLLKGEVTPFTAKNKRLYYTLNGSDTEKLLLVGNYTSNRTEKFFLEHPEFTVLEELTYNDHDLIRTPRKHGEILSVDPQEYRLFRWTK
jgi:hypothetical protein